MAVMTIIPPAAPAATMGAMMLMTAISLPFF